MQKPMSINNINKKLNSRNGQALVEMAFVLPIIILLIMGVVEFGRIFNAYLIITNASREAARVAVVHGTDADISNSVQKSTTTLEASRMTVQIDPAEGTRTRGDELSVTINYNLEIICPGFSAILPNPFPLKSKTVMRME